MNPGSFHGRAPRADEPLGGVPLLVHSPVRWDAVWQRPQQLLSRLALHHPVLLVEEPVVEPDGERARLQLSRPTEGVVRAVPRIPCAQLRRAASPMSVVRGLLRLAFGHGGALAGAFTRPVQWFFTPAPAVEMLGTFDECAVVYECFDAAAGFADGATEAERLLLDRANVVFAAADGFVRSRVLSHAHLHVLGGGVEAEHFGRARHPDTVPAAELATLPRPILGYFGVIDERIDFAALAALATSAPAASIVMLGPILRVDSASIPDAPNVHWLGQKAYQELPAYLKAFDVCLMPLARAAGRPTMKALEYMAAGKPIVSTAVAAREQDVWSLVEMAHTPEEFASLAIRAAAHPDAARVAAGVARAQRETWDAVAGEMRAIVLDAIMRPPAPRIAMAITGADARTTLRRAAIAATAATALAPDHQG